MGYEQSPACVMLASNCACCSRPLVDSVSVEVGVGPDCREKYGFDTMVSEDARSEANRLIHHIALQQTGPEVMYAIIRLQELGFSSLAERVAKRIGAVRIEPSQDGQWFEVTAPYRESALSGWRRIPGRRWNQEKKHNAVPVAAKSALWSFLKSAYPGFIGSGPKGLFLIQ